MISTQRLLFAYLALLTIAFLPACAKTTTVANGGASAAPPAMGPRASSAPSTPAPAAPSAVTPSASPQLQDAFFDYEKALIKSDMKRSLQEDAQLLKAHPELAVTIGGYCDERGTDEYNLALGNRRAESIKRYLVALGVKPTQLKTISYGKEKPFCTDHTEACYQQNRRGHFISAAENP